MAFRSTHVGLVDDGAHVRLRAAVASDVGARRTVNQDAAFVAAWGAVVADGVGGGPAGDLASAALVHRLAAGRPVGLEADQLAAAVRGANWDLRAHVERDPTLEGMATTFTGLFPLRGAVLLVHTGDSRAYLLRDGALAQRTRDDSFVQELVDQGVIAAADAASHPHRNLITASLSGAEHDDPFVVVHDARAGDRWLLCSDGLSDYVPHDVLATLLTSHDDPQAAAWACVDSALEAETHDNVTAVVCDVVAGRVDLPVMGSPSFAGAAAGRFMEGMVDAESA